MEELKYCNSGFLNIEILKNNQRYHVLIPVGVPWEEAEAAIDELKASLIDMKTKIQAQQQQADPSPIQTDIAE